MNIKLYVYDVTIKKNFIVNALYEKNTTIKDLLDVNFPNTNKGIIDKEKRLILRVDYYYHNKKLCWDEHVDNLLVSDFLDRFPEYKQGIYLVINIGGIGCAGNVLEFAVETYNVVNNFIINNPLVMISIGFVFNNLKKWINNKKSECTKFSSFKSSLHSKKVWKINELIESLELEDEDTAILLMLSMGYDYHIDTHTFILKEM